MGNPDPQRQAAYEWEDEFRDWNRQTASLVECRRYIETACAHYAVKPPRVVGHRGKEITFYQAHEDIQARFLEKGAAATISLRPDGRNIPIALHESAHAIASVWLPWTIEGHGREWLGIYMWLLEAASIAPSVALEASAKKHGLKWLRDLTPLRLRKLSRRLGIKIPA